MNILVVADTRNRLFRRDGNEFKREARAFAEHWEKKGATVTLVETREKKNWKKHRLVLKAIREHSGPIDVLAMFCHGWHRGISLGFNKWNSSDLVSAITDHNNKEPIDIILYACKTFKKGNSFGPLLSSKFRQKAMVVGRSTSGHTARNPFVYVGGKYETIVIPQDDRYEFLSCRQPWIPEIALGWWKRRKSVAWRKWREDLKTSHRFDFWEGR